MTDKEKLLNLVNNYHSISMSEWIYNDEQAIALNKEVKEYIEIIEKIFG